MKNLECGVLTRGLGEGTHTEDVQRINNIVFLLFFIITFLFMIDNNELELRRGR